MPYRPLRSESGRIHVCGHRGHSAGAPENTLPAIEAAAALGASVCEIDIVLTRDGEAVLLHDEILDRTTDGHGLAGDHDLTAIQALDAGGWIGPAFAGTRVPTLAQALRTARRLGLGLLVEIKERRRADALIARLGEVLAEERALEEVLLISFDHPSLVEVRRRIPAARTELITHARHVAIDAIARRAGAASVSIEWDMFHADDALALHAAGIAVRISVPKPERMALRRRYGLDDEAAMVAALRAGLVDVVNGDDVAAVAALVARAAG